MKDGDLPNYDEPLAFDEFERRLALARVELDGPEGREMLEHIAWFMRRYPTPTARVRYALRRYEAAMTMRGILSPMRSHRSLHVEGGDDKSEKP